MIELSLAIYSEANIRAWQNAHAKRPSKRVSLRSIQGYLAEGNEIDLQNCAVFPKPLVGGKQPLMPGQYISTGELRSLGVTEILVRYNDQRTVQPLKVK